MTATAVAQGPTTTRTSPYRLSFGHVLRAEWIKFRTLRSTAWTLAITVVVMAAIALMFAALMSSLSDDPELAASSGGLMPGVMIVTFGYSFAQLVVAVLGALTITGEYSTGMIRSTFSAVPTRLPAFAAKSLVLAVVTFVVSALGVVASYLVAMPFLSGTPLEVDLGAEGTIRALLGAPLYLAAIAVLSVALGAIIRNSAGTIFGLVALLLVVPSILQAIPTDWVRDLAQFLPSTAGERLVIGDAMNGMGTDFILSPWQGFAVLVAWVAVAWVAAALVIKRRDA
ncbi:ABC transporter permease [Cellulosimicrobium sp. NPDC057127]|uniref:ABC transporter permease n=1 Tax=Cellulosimicrobium sp. NPDC057127 TaxID=3346026 RepID=UPI00363D7004